MAKLQRKKISWESRSSSTVLKYRLYWAAGDKLGYDSDYIELKNTTQVLLPDAIPALPKKGFDIQVGLSAINDAGNESDITMLDARLDFSVPDAPRNLKVEDMNLVSNARNIQRWIMAFLGVIFLTGLGIYGLIKFGERNLYQFDEIRSEKQDYAMVASPGKESDSPVSKGEEGSEELGQTEAASDLEVEAIIWSNDQTNSFALINGSKVRVGELIGESIVTDIGRDYVEFEVGETRFRVTLR